MSRWKISCVSVCLGVSIFSGSGWAEQVIPVQDNGRVTAPMSASHLNRIAVIGDRIKSVKGTDGEYTLNHDALAGDIYVSSLLPERLSLNLFITTEKGAHYQLQLPTTRKFAETLLLKPQPSHRPLLLSQAWEASEVIALLQAIKKNLPMENYKITTTPSSPPLRLSADVELRALKHYQSDELQGDVFQVKNCSSHPLVLAESQFYQTKTVAIALVPLMLPPQGTSTLYRIKTHDA